LRYNNRGQAASPEQLIERGKLCSHERIDSGDGDRAIAGRPDEAVRERAVRSVVGTGKGTAAAALGGEYRGRCQYERRGNCV